MALTSELGLILLIKSFPTLLLHRQMDQVEKMRRVMSAIVNAAPSASFSDIINSERDAFRGMHVTYATRATEFHIHQVRVDQLNKECPLIHSFFDGSGLLFYSDAVHADTLAGQAKIELDYSIMLDKNVCEEVRRYVNGKQPSDLSALAQLLMLVRGRRDEGFNYDFMAYLAEELEHFYKPNNDRPLQTFRALKRLDFLDEASLATYPKLSTSYEIEVAVKRATDDLVDEVIRTGALSQLQQNRLAGYAVLLQAMLLRWEGVSLESAMRSLVQFSISTLGKLAKMEIYFGWKLLATNRAVSPFFRPIASPSNKVMGAVRGMSWDLSLFRTAEIMAGIRRPVGDRRPDFFLPFIASNDRKFRDMVAACPLRAIVVNHDAKQINSLFRDEQEFQTVLRQAIAGAGINSGNAAQAKRLNGNVDESHLRSVISTLESRAAEVVGESSVAGQR